MVNNMALVGKSIIVLTQNIMLAKRRVFTLSRRLIENNLISFLSMLASLSATNLTQYVVILTLLDYIEFCLVLNVSFLRSSFAEP